MTKTSKVARTEVAEDSKVLYVEPKEYQLKSHESAYTFKNFYIQYGRFHMDQK